MEADSVERRQEELGIHILENIRNELYYYFPYLDGAFACISGKGSEQTGTIGTDGAFFLFSPEYLLKLCKKAGGSAKRLSAYAAALSVSAPFSGGSGGQTLMEPGL